VTSNDELLNEAKKEIAEGNKEEGVKKLVKIAEELEKKKEYGTAARVYEEAAVTYRDIYHAEECFKAFDRATLMMVRMPQSPEVFKEIVRVNTRAAEIAEAATEYKKAADFYFRAKDFAMTDEEKKTLDIRTADALENFADSMEEKENYSETISLLRKVSRLYYTGGDNELGERIDDRAVKIAQRWAKIARNKGDFVSAGNALAEAAQIMQTKGESPEATRTMMEAGEFYEAAHLYEKAGNIYDAAQEEYKLQRLTSARNQALSKAAEAYLKMEGKPESVAPLLVKGGNMFSELGRVMKAKWAFKRASEMFEELAARASRDGDIESEKKYLRYQAMCLKNWGYNDQAKQIYTQVTEFYLNQSKDQSENDDKELQAVALEEAAEVLLESGEKEESTKCIEQAIDLYTKLADEKAETEDHEGASRLYSKAADCVARLGDKERAEAFHCKASEKAEKAAEYYKELGVPELSTIWIRTAGTEALLTNSSKMIERAIELLEKSADGFKTANELKESFEDLFGVFEARFMYYPDKRRPIKAVISSMNEIAKTLQDDVLNVLVSLVTALNEGNHIGALLILQANEEDLLSKEDRIRKMIAQSKKVRASK
jgi:tetratricopeptide (TPR) repeat protein